MRQVRQCIGGLGNIMFKQAYVYAQMRRGQIPDVYVQSEKYWKEFADEIKLMFAVDTPPIDKVSIHIRRGDYLATDFYVDPTKTGYYEKAVKYFPDDKFLVFYKDRQNPDQDEADKEWIKNYLDKIVPGRYEIYSGTGTETDDLNAMASCKHNIGANSSFSWWAAYLNPNPRKIAIFPEQWFADGLQRTEMLDEWIKI
jgi:hypothetical protein